MWSECLFEQVGAAEVGEKRLKELFFLQAQASPQMYVAVGVAMVG